MNILLAVDGSEHTKHMLAWLVTHEEWIGSRHRYTVLNVVPPIPPHAMEFLDPEVLRAYGPDQADAVFAPIRTFLERHQITATYMHKVGFAADEIAELANSHDMLIMGSHGRGALSSLVMGSVATRVLASCKTPVLLIR